MPKWLYHVEKYVEVEADTREEADEAMWAIVIEDGSDGLDAELAEYTDDSGNTLVCD